MAKGNGSSLEKLFGHIDPECREVVAHEVSGYVETISAHRLRRLLLFTDDELDALREGLELRHESLLAQNSKLTEEGRFDEVRDFTHEAGIALLDDIEELHSEDDEEAR